MKELAVDLLACSPLVKEKAVVWWAVEYGRSLKWCMILWFRCGGVTGVELGGGGGGGCSFHW